MQLTMFQLAQRYVGQIHEIPGVQDHPLIQWWLSLCQFPLDVHDEVPWCSAFVNGLAWDLRLPRSGSAAARSWLGVGEAVPVTQATVGYDVVILQRGKSPQPGRDVLAAPGHVGLYAGLDSGHVLVLAGNQGNTVSVAAYPLMVVLGVRRIFSE